MPVKYIQGKVILNIDLDNGLYLMGIDSATGKTRLYNYFKLYKNKFPVFGMSFYDIDTPIPEGKEVYLFDRYDMYNGKFADKIIELSKKSIVLVDCKSTCYIPSSAGMALVDMPQPYTIRVRGY